MKIPRLSPLTFAAAVTLLPLSAQAEPQHTCNASGDCLSSEICHVPTDGPDGGLREEMDGGFRGWCVAAPADAGSGSTGDDAGMPASDAGATLADAGITAPADAGSTPDAGTPTDPIDAGSTSGGDAGNTNGGDDDGDAGHAGSDNDGDGEHGDDDDGGCAQMGPSAAAPFMLAAFFLVIRRRKRFQK